MLSPFEQANLIAAIVQEQSPRPAAMLGRRQCSRVGGVDGETPDNYSGYCTSRCSSVPLMKHTNVDFSWFVLVIFVCVLAQLFAVFFGRFPVWYLSALIGD